VLLGVIFSERSIIQQWKEVSSMEDRKLVEYEEDDPRDPEDDDDE